VKNHVFQFIDEVKGGNIPREYMPAIQKGFKESMANGVLAGFSLDSLKVRVFDGSYHAVDSDSLSFEMAARLGFKAACRKAKSVLLEPIMKLEVTIPDEYFGEIVGDLSSKRSKILGTKTRGNLKIISALTPLAELPQYATRIRTLTAGRGTFYMEPSHYEEVPVNITNQLIEQQNKLQIKELK